MCAYILHFRYPANKQNCWTAAACADIIHIRNKIHEKTRKEGSGNEKRRHSVFPDIVRRTVEAANRTL